MTTRMFCAHVTDTRELRSRAAVSIHEHASKWDVVACEFSQVDLPAFGRQYAVWTASKEGYTTSLIAAEKFGKEHKEVLRDIRNLECTQMFRESNFALSSYKSKQNKDMPYYQITRDGLMFLVMGYTGAKASPILMPAQYETQPTYQ